MIQEIALNAVPSQYVKVVLGDQNVQILLQQKPQGIFVDVNVDGVDVSTSVLALNNTPLIARPYLGITGNLLLVDTAGTDDPDYTGLGDRFRLVYVV